MATIKGLWKGGGEKLKALMAYRATSLGCGYSPAQLLMGRQLRTTIPQLPASLLPRWPNVRGFKKAEKQLKEKQQLRYNLCHRARPLWPLQPGQNVWLPREEKRGTVVQKATTPRSYIIHTDEGQIRRNRTHLRPVHQLQPQVPLDKTVTTTESDNQVTHQLENTNTDNQRQTATPNTPYVTISGRVSRPPERLDL